MSKARARRAAQTKAVGGRRKQIAQLFRSDLFRRLDVYLWTEGRLHAAGQTVGDASEMYVDIVAWNCTTLMRTQLGVKMLWRQEPRLCEVLGTEIQWDILQDIIVTQLMVTEFHEYLHQLIYDARKQASEEAVEKMAGACIRYVKEAER